jgi:hypothetical protein
VRDLSTFGGLPRNGVDGSIEREGTNACVNPLTVKVDTVGEIDHSIHTL